MHRLFAVFSLILAGCSPAGSPDGEVYTLYRSSIVDVPRLHVATFDAGDGEDYNRENCTIAASLFAGQPGVAVRYWCEKGRHQK